MPSALDAVGIISSCFPPQLLARHEMALRRGRDRLKDWLLSLFVPKGEIRYMPDGLSFDDGARRR
jgi:hypothetical protein